MRKSGTASLAFFYCDFRDDEKKDRRGLLSSLLFQLCGQSNSYSNILSDFYSEHGNGSQDPSDAALAQCLKEIVRCAGELPIYIVVDALDECPNARGTPSSRRRVLTLLEELVDLHPNLRVCVTARPEADIETALNRLTSHSISLHDEDGQRQDMLDYISSVVNSDPEMERWRMEDKELVIRTLLERAHGM
jgi:NACHT domain